MPAFSRLLPAAALVLALLPAPACLAVDSPPVAIHQEPPEYPFSLRLSGNKGNVVLEFVVSPQGDVVKVSVVSSSHPDFEAPAVEALLKWKFRPGMRNGKPVWVRMRVPVFFELNGAIADGGVNVWKVPETPPRSLPERFQYDEPPKPLLTSAPVYPFELLEHNVTGRAKLTFAIDPQGRTHLVKLNDASRPEFGASIVAMIGAWSFEPAMKKGKPCWAILGKEEDFERYSRDFPISDSAERLLKALRKGPCPILMTQAQVAELDEPLKGRFQPGPVVPDDLVDTGVRQEAVIEFIVDHAGHAQLPRIVSSGNPEFGWAAATAVARWQYTIPAIKGKPVDVMIRVPFAYSGGHPAPAKS